LEEVVGLDISYHDGSFYESEPEHIQAYGKRKVAKKTPFILTIVSLNPHSRNMNLEILLYPGICQ